MRTVSILLLLASCGRDVACDDDDMDRFPRWVLEEEYAFPHPWCVDCYHASRAICTDRDGLGGACAEVAAVYEACVASDGPFCFAEETAVIECVIECPSFVGSCRNERL